jgi:hypothetical protein
MLLLALAPAALAASWTVQKTKQPFGELQNPDAEFNGVSCPSATDCVAVGLYADSNGKLRTLAERWNGTSWATQTTANHQPITGDFLQAVSCTSAIACMAVGSYGGTPYTASGMLPLAERWNGISWTLEPVPTPPNIITAKLGGVSCTAATACTAVGFYQSGNLVRPLAETWNGAGWQLQSAPGPSSTLSEFDAVSCTSSSACTAVGNRDSNPYLPVLTLAERWDGTSWAVQSTVDPSPTGNSENFFRGVSCTSASECVAVGAFNDPTDSTYRPLAEGWNGSSWALQTISPTPALLYGVECPSVTACVAVGQSPTATFAEGWDGTSWTVQSTPVLATNTIDSQLNGVSCTAATVCTAVGYADERTALGRTRTAIAFRYS